jgi:hypothetical protein
VRDSNSRTSGNVAGFGSHITSLRDMSASPTLKR